MDFKKILQIVALVGGVAYAVKLTGVFNPETLLNRG